MGRAPLSSDAADRVRRRRLPRGRLDRVRGARRRRRAHDRRANGALRHDHEGTAGPRTRPRHRQDRQPRPREQPRRLRHRQPAGPGRRRRHRRTGTRLTARSIDAVLFDFGETLFSRGDGADAIVNEARRLGADIDRERASALWNEIQERGRAPEEMAKGRDLSPEAHRECWTALYSIADVVTAGIGEALYEREIAPTGWSPVPDAEPTLRALREMGVGIGVVSDAGWDIRPVFAHHGFLELIDEFVISNEHGRVKPDPELFGIACEALGAEPHRTLMVGDNPLSDGGAVGAGLPVLLLPLADLSQPRGLGAVVRIVG